MERVNQVKRVVGGLRDDGGRAGNKCPVQRLEGLSVESGDRDQLGCYWIVEVELTIATSVVVTQWGQDKIPGGRSAQMISVG